MARNIAINFMVNTFFDVVQKEIKENLKRI